jgi:hypothetical protein
MAVTFRFQEIPSHIFGHIYRPIALVEFKHRVEDTWQPIEMIVDTGADYSILPRSYAAPLGVDLDRDCVALHTVGIGGSEQVFLYRGQPIRLGRYERKIAVGFLSREQGPALLGRHEFLETFRVILAGRKIRFDEPRVSARHGR